MPTIREHKQGLNLGRRYELYKIDLTRFGLGEFRLHPGDEGAVDHAVSFGGGAPFLPWPIISSGWSVSAQGRLPRPVFGVANAGRIFTPLIIEHNGLKRAQVTRIRTYEKFLDGQPAADPTKHDPLEIFEINRIRTHGLVEGVEGIQWELRAPIDQPGSQVPKIQVTRGPCQFSYRVFDEETGEFVNGTCPYRGAETFDEDNNVSNNVGDICAQTVPACIRRHGENVSIPYMGFPSAGSIRR